MPDFREEVRKRLAHLNLEPIREASIVEEVALHMEDRYRDLVAMAVPRSRLKLRSLLSWIRAAGSHAGSDIEPHAHIDAIRPAIRALGHFRQICGRTYAIALEHFA